MLAADVDDEEGAGEARHLGDAAEHALELLVLAAAHEALLLLELGRGAVGLLPLERLHAADRLPDRLEVGEHAAEPAVGHVGHPGALGLRLHDLLRLLLRPDEEDLPAAAGEAPGGVGGVLEELLALLEVEDVDAVALHEDVRGHLRVPPARQVPEVGAGAEHVFDLHTGHSRGALL
ncbi:MAG TPA: hypothetical protein VK610_10075 [Rhodothermales bacterium]|nr:hypothetical protein [Rhodothermales bacterium]